MVKRMSWLILALCIIPFVIKPAYAVELIISDRGRNTAWSENLRMGDDFSTQGADTRPMGGTIPNTTAINQMLVPMPNDVELKQMSQTQEKLWIDDLGKLLKDRVHIAITNDATLFEIQLLQNTTQPSDAGMLWKENSHTERFAQMAYQAMGQLVKHLQEQKEPVRLTAALADTGSTVFALGVDNWKPYASTFRRVDLVDGHASLTQIRPVINTLGSKRVRLFRTTGIPKSPPMAIGRKEVAENLLKSHPYLTEYVLTSSKSEESASGKYEQTPWVSSLSDSGTFTVEQRQFVRGKVNEQTMTGEYTGLEFRDPVGGLDPANFDIKTDGALKMLGIIAPVLGEHMVPSFPEFYKSGARISETEEGTVHYVRTRDLSPGRMDLPNRALEIFSDYSKSSGRPLIVAETLEEVPKITASGNDALYFNGTLVNGGNVVRDIKKLANDDVNNINLVGIGFVGSREVTNGLHRFNRDIAGQPNVNSNNIRVYAIEPQRGAILGVKKIEKLAVYSDLGLLKKSGHSVAVVAIENSGNFLLDKNNIARAELVGIDVIKAQSSRLIHKSLEPFQMDIPNPLDRVMGNPQKERTWLDNNMVFEGSLGEVMATRDMRSKPNISIHQDNHQPVTHIKMSSQKLDNKLLSRLSHDTTIFAKTPFELDVAYINRRNLKINRDPFGYKTPRSNDLVIMPLKPLEDSYKLGPITRNSQDLPYYSMKAGYYDSQKYMDQYPDLSRSGTTNFSPLKNNSQNSELGSFSDNYSMRSGFNKQLPLGQNIGGVMLNTPAQVEGGKATLNTGNISLVFQNSDGVIDFTKLQRFSTALWATYLSVEGPGISIDPIEKDLEYGNKHKVRHIGQIRNTELGKVMRETDYLMKRWAIGTHRPDIKSFLSPDDIDKNLAGKIDSNRASRFWFIPKGFTFKRSNNMLLFSSGNMTLETEYLDNHLKDEKNPANELFAQWFTDNYGLVAERYSIFKKLFEYAQLVSLSTYLRENRIPMLWFLMANRELILTENAIDKVDELVKKSGYKWTVKMYGGVELDLSKTLRDEKIYTTNSTLQNVEDNLTTEQRDNNAPVVFSENNTSYTVSSKNILKLINSSAEGDIIQTDLALADQYHEKVPDRDGADNEWKLIAPRLELVRYYNPELQTRAQFGNGWHLLVPFRLETEKQISLFPGNSPEHVVLVNLLSGIREVVLQEKCEGATLKYRGNERDGLTKCLERKADGSWVLEDILGGKFTFDHDGDLTEMTLRENKQVKYKLISKKYTKNIPGYTAKYRYDIRMINGKNQKILTSIKQSNHTARIDWHPDDTKQIVGIRVLKQGRPVEVLKYAYGNKKMLKKISAQSGQNISVRYQDNNQRVSVSQ